MPKNTPNHDRTTPTCKYFDHSIDHLDHDDNNNDGIRIGSSSSLEILILPNEMIINILEYLNDGFFVIRNCGLINRQFRYCSRNVPLRNINFTPSYNNKLTSESCCKNRYAKQYHEVIMDATKENLLVSQLIMNLECSNLKRLVISIYNQSLCEQMATCPVFKNLEELDISTNSHYHSSSIESIVESPIFSNLTSLNVSDGFSNLDLLFGEKSTITNLKKLNLNKNRLSALSILTNWKYSSKLTELSASNCSFSETDFEALVSNDSNLYNLTYLNIEMSFVLPLDRMKERLFSECSNFNQLKTFRMGFNLFSPFAISPKAQFQNMITLDMSCLKIGEKSFKSIIRNQTLKKLENLILKDCRLGWEFIESLTNPSINCLTSLKSLDMNNNKVSSKGLQLLASSNLILQMKVIELNSNLIGIEGATSILTNSERLKHLKLLSVLNNNFGTKLLELRTCHLLSEILKVDD